MVTIVKSTARFALLALATSLAFGCTTAPTTETGGTDKEPVKEKKAPVDGQLFEGNGYSIVMPKTWKVVDMANYDKAIESLKADKSFAQVKSGAEAIKGNSNVKLFALAPEHSVPNFAANLNILEMQLPPGIGLDRVLEENQKQLKTQMKKDITFTKFKAGNADAGRVNWEMEMRGEKLGLTTVIGVSKGNQIVFTFTTPAAKKAGAQAEIDKTISSIELD